jgi:DNA-binding MarR family transcriptional regulator
MKHIKLSGRERAVLRYIDWATGTNGDELLDCTKIEPEDLVDVLNGLMEVGYVEMMPYAEHTDLDTFREKTFEVNPSYALELRAAMQRL